MPRWSPNKGPQTDFLASTAFEVLYGGAAGGGKSEALTVAPLRFIGHPRFSAMTIRSSFPELERTLIKRAREIYPSGGGDYNGQQHLWRFPSGAEIGFGYLEHDGDEQQYQGAEFQFLGFDELTLIAEAQYLFLLSRVRGPAELPKMVRATANPGGPGHGWVQKRWWYWLGHPEPSHPNHQKPIAEPGEVLWLLPQEDGSETVVPAKTEGAFSRTFIPAKVDDNQKGDPDYKARLGLLDPVRRRQLRDGDWNVRESAGLYFKPGWWQYLDRATEDGMRWIRVWDLAATEAKGSNDPDWTVGAKMGAPHGIDDDGKESLAYGTVVADVARGRWSPNGVDAKMMETAERDGVDVEIYVPEDPGAAGKTAVAHFRRLLEGYTVRSYPVNGSKVKKAGPYSSQVEGGNVHLVRGTWNDSWVDEHGSFPTKGVHDDQVDAGAAGYTVLHGKVPFLFEVG